MANNNKRVKPAAPPVSRTQRSLMYVGGSILGFGIIAIVALLIGEATLTPSAFEGSAIWSVVAFIPEIAIPLGFIFFIIFIVFTFVQRSRAAEGADK